MAGTGSGVGRAALPAVAQHWAELTTQERARRVAKWAGYDVGYGVPAGAGLGRAIVARRAVAAWLLLAGGAGRVGDVASALRVTHAAVIRSRTALRSFPNGCQDRDIRLTVQQLAADVAGKAEEGGVERIWIKLRKSGDWGRSGAKGNKGGGRRKGGGE